MSLRDQIFKRKEKLEIQAKRSLGQNFLVDSKIVDCIVDCVDHFAASQCIEIGPGLGSLTDHWDKEKTLLIELDSILANYWEEKGFETKASDALKVKWPTLKKNKPLTLVSNLPYQISSRIVVEMSENLVPDHMVLMFQKEVADRIVSSISKPSYGFLSVVAQSFWDIRKVVFVSSHCFFPKPKVDGYVLEFFKKESIILNRTQFIEFVKNCFQERRKFLLNKAKKMNLKDEFEKFLKKYSLNPKVRAEELTPKNYQDLFLSL